MRVAAPHLVDSIVKFDEGVRKRAGRPVTLGTAEDESSRQQDKCREHQCAGADQKWCQARVLTAATFHVGDGQKQW